MRMKIDTRVAGFAEARRRLQAMKARAANMIPAWEELLRWWARENRKHFTTRGGRWLTPWKPLSPRTIRWKRAHGYPADPLIRTGKMADQLTNRPLGFERLTPYSVDAGTRLRRAYFHQSGTRHMPARKLVNATQIEREQAATSAVKSWIVDGEPRVDPAEVLRP